jgi:ABC-type transport system involved in cytochrome c biogenesis permease subunit
VEYAYLPAGLALSLLYLLVALAAGASFFSGRKAFSIATDALAAIAVPSHLAYLLVLGLTARKLPLTSIFEALSAIAFFLALLSWVLRFAAGARATAVFAFPLIFALQLLSSIGSGVVYLEQGLFPSILLMAHSAATLFGYAGFAYSMILGLMYLHLFRELKTKKPRLMFDRLPPLEVLNRTNEIALIVGFASLTAGIVLGIVLAAQVWGRVPLEDPKIVLSVLLWLAYVAGFVSRITFGWSGRKLSYVAVLGFLVIVTLTVTLRLFPSTFHRF